MFEFEQVVEGIFEEERGVLDARAREAAPRVLVKLQALRLGAIGHGLPILFRREDQAEVARVDALRRSGRRLREMSDELMAFEFKREGRRRDPSEAAAQAVHIEPLGLFQIGDREGEMKEHLAHVKSITYPNKFICSAGVAGAGASWRRSRKALSLRKSSAMVSFRLPWCNEIGRASCRERVYSAVI